MRIYVAMPLWVGEQDDLLQRCLDAWAESPHDVTIEIDANRPCAFSFGDRRAHVYVNFDETYRGFQQTWYHRRRMVERQDQYDLFVYQESDMLITADNIEAWLEWVEYIPENWGLRFVRFVCSPDGTRSIDASRPIDPWGLLEHDGKRFAWHSLLFAASYVLTHAQLKRCIQKKAFSLNARKVLFGSSEDACSEPYLRGFDHTVFPPDDLDRFLIEHLSGKYTDAGITLDEFRSHLDA